MWLVTYFLITIIHKIAEAGSVQKHIGENCLLDLWITIFQKVMAAIFCEFNDVGIKLYIFDHAESEFRPPEFSESLFNKIWDKELKYIMMVSMKCSLDLTWK